MTGPTVALIEELGVNAVQLPHAQGEVALRGLDEKTVMVGHETVGVAQPIVAFIDMLEGVQEVQEVGVVLEDVLRFIAPSGDMIDCAGIFDAKRVGHEARLTEHRATCKEKDLLCSS
jgi:hypothetical protein